MTKMRTCLLSVLVLFCLLLVVPKVSRGQSNPGTTKAPSDIPWSIFTDKDVYYPGEPIYLTDLIRNKDTFTISYGAGPLVDVDKMHMTLTKDGSQSTSSTIVTPTVYGVYLPREEEDTGFGSVVSPNNQIETCFLLNQVRDMTLPGHYRLYLTDTKGILNSDESVKDLAFISNTITFTIMPTEREAKASLVKMTADVSTPAPSDQATQGVILTVATDKDDYDPDDPIICTVAIENHSQSTLDMVAKDPVDPSLLTVVLLKGDRIYWSDRVMPITAYGKLELQQNAPIRSGPYLLPGQKYVRTFLLSRVRDMTMAGGYTIQLNETLNVKGSENQIHLTSNVATVKVNWPARLIPGHPRELSSEIPAKPSQPSKGN